VECENWRKEISAQIEKKSPNHLFFQSPTSAAAAGLTRSASICITQTMMENVNATNISSNNSNSVIASTNARRLRHGTHRDAHSKIMNSLKTLRGSTILAAQTQNLSQQIKDKNENDENFDGPSISQNVSQFERENEESVRIE